MDMYKIIIVCALLTLISCNRNNPKISSEDFPITINLEKNYPKKDIVLQEFMDVKYIALKTTDDFLCQGQILHIGKDFILAKNNIQDGNIFIFNNNGDSIRILNRCGAGSEEYAMIFKAALDEDNNELFINDAMLGQVIIYDLYGNFKRRFSYDKELRIDDIYNFDNENLIGKIGVDKDNTSLFGIISKQDGSIVENLQIPYEEKKTTVIEKNGGPFMFYSYSPILPFDGNWLFSEVSSDTIYKFSKNHNLNPFVVKTPSIRSLNSDIFLFLKVLTTQYYLMEKVEKKTEKFVKTDLAYDKSTGKTFRYSLFNNDLLEEQPINMATINPLQDGTGFWQIMEAHDLIKLYKNDKLQGPLKTLAAELAEDDNPIILLAKNKGKSIVLPKD